MVPEVFDGTLIMMMLTKRLWRLRSSNPRPSLIFQEALMARHCSLHTGLRRNIYEEKYFFVSISNPEFIIDQSYNFSRVLWIDLVKLPNKSKLKDCVAEERIRGCQLWALKPESRHCWEEIFWQFVLGGRSYALCSGMWWHQLVTVICHHANQVTKLSSTTPTRLQ